MKRKNQPGRRTINKRDILRLCGLEITDRLYLYMEKENIRAPELIRRALIDYHNNMYINKPIAPQETIMEVALPPRSAKQRRLVPWGGDEGHADSR